MAKVFTFSNDSKFGSSKIMAIASMQTFFSQSETYPNISRTLRPTTPRSSPPTDSRLQYAPVGSRPELKQTICPRVHATVAAKPKPLRLASRVARYTRAATVDALLTHTRTFFRTRRRSRSSLAPPTDRPPPLPRPDRLQHASKRTDPRENLSPPPLLFPSPIPRPIAATTKPRATQVGNFPP